MTTSFSHCTEEKTEAQGEYGPSTVLGRAAEVVWVRILVPFLAM